MWIIKKLQNNPVTGWLWCYWQHEDTGRTTKAFVFNGPGRRWYRIGYTDYNNH